jgi:two-component system response regulator WspF
VAEPSECLKAGTVHVACTADHVRVNAEGRLVYTREPIECAHRPSVDVFFESLLHARVKPGVAVLLTGMGRDGAWGMKTLREAGWDTIVQDEATSVIWGMPGAAVQLQAAKRILPIDRIGPALRAIAARAQP